jgi:hypothetical protein
MPNQHKTPMLGWHPPAEDSAWVRAEAERRDVDLKVILNEALAEYRERHENREGSEA